MDDVSISIADRYASIAEEATEDGDLVKAIDAHQNAAEQYLLIMKATTSQETLKTLRLLRINHSQKAEELQKRLSWIKDHQSDYTINRPAYGQNNHQSMSSPNSPWAFTQEGPTGLLSRTPLGNLNDNSSFCHISHNNGNYTFSTSTSLSMSASISSSDGSFLFLTYPADMEDEPRLPFDFFWDFIENEKWGKIFAAPLAFATAPLGFDSISSGDKSSSTKQISPCSSYTTCNEMSDTMVRGTGGSSVLNSYFVVDHESMEDYSTTSSPQEGNLSIHSCWSSTYNSDTGESEPSLRITSYDDLRQLKTREELRIENEALKTTVDILTRQVAALEKAAEENALLRSSIIQFRQDVQRGKIKQLRMKSGY